MSEGILALEGAGFNCYSRYIFEKGISAYYDGEELHHAIGNMNRLEDGIAANPKPKSFPSFGWGRAEALYCMERTNIPNSVFPLFWWETHASGKKRNTLFNRG